VREEIRVKKVVDRHTVEAQDTIRREQLDIDTTGELHVDETGTQREEAV
jgi:stress response protein YsnF